MVFRPRFVEPQITVGRSMVIAEKAVSKFTGKLTELNERGEFLNMG
jgi:hypothetical protein